jgi:NAD-dependent deacetylase
MASSPGVPNGAGATRAATDLVARAERVCVLTGAGVSTDSGIPDFRGPDGLWTRDPGAQRYVDFDAYRHDPSLRVQSWQRRAAHPAFSAQPNAAHLALVDLHRAGRLPVTLTQNIDGLHQRSGLPSEAVIELHGTVHESECLECQDRRPMPEAVARVHAGDPDPSCLSCGGILKSATVFFGQPLNRATFDAATRAVLAGDVLIAIGSSLTVQPVAGLVPLAKRSGLAVIVVNAQRTPYDDVADVVIREPIGTAIPTIASGVSANHPPSAS